MLVRGLVLSAALLLSAGCSEVFPREKVVFDLVEFVTTSGRPGIKLNARNTGDLDVYNVACDAYAMRGSNIVDTAFLYFANGATIRTGQSSEDVGTWFGLTDFSQFEDARWDCSFIVLD